MQGSKKLRDYTLYIRMTNMAENYQSVKDRVEAACQAAARSVTPDLLAVSKKHSEQKIAALAALGQHSFGESYAQEGVEKINHLKHLNLVWHFIGPIQSNKTKVIAESFDWVQSVDRMKVLKRLGQQRPEGKPPLNVLLQVKIGHEDSKSGANVSEVMAMAAMFDQYESLKLRGLMCIPPPSDDSETQIGYFLQAKRVFDELQVANPEVDTLSMGMSGDLESAIMTGSTMVRVGTDLFGVRPS